MVNEDEYNSISSCKNIVTYGEKVKLGYIIVRSKA